MDKEALMGRVRELGRRFYAGRSTPERRVTLWTPSGIPNLVDSQNLLDFLRGARELSGEEMEFSRHLSLERFTSFFQDLYEVRPEGFVMNQDQRREIRELEQEAKSNLGKNHWLLEHIRETSSRKAIAERARVIYAESGGAVKATKIVSGDHTSVHVGSLYRWMPLLRRTPLIDVHTHPTNTLPSPDDYFLLISKFGRKPLIPAFVVLCPDIQILALRTTQTPAWLVAHTESFIDGYNKEIFGRDQKRIEQLEGRVKVVRKHPFGLIQTNLTRVLSDMEQAERDKESGSISEAEYQELLEKATEVLNPGEEYRKKQERVLERAEALFSREASRALNESLLLLPRSLNVKLYSSENMTDFYQFSA